MNGYLGTSSHAFHSHKIYQNQRISLRTKPETQQLKHSRFSFLDTDAYLKYCEKNYDKLNDDERGLLMTQLSGIFTPSTPEQVKRISNFARKRIGELPAQDLMWVGQAIYELESPKKH